MFIVKFLQVLQWNSLFLVSASQMQSLQTPLEQKPQNHLACSVGKNTFTQYVVYMCACQTHKCYLRLCPQVNDAIQFNVLPKLFMQPAVPVLIDRPFSFVQTLALVQVGCKDIPGTRTQILQKF